MWRHGDYGLLKSFFYDIQAGHNGGCLENIQLLSAPEREDQVGLS